MKKITSIAGSLILVLVVGSMLASDLYVPTIEDEQERPLAVVRRFKPNVELASLNRETIELNIEDNIGEQLFNGDTLSTDKDGYALVIFMDNSIAKVKPTSQLIVKGQEKPNSRNTTRRIDLDKGEIGRAHV